MHFKQKPVNKIHKSRLVIGRKPMIEALETGMAIDKIFILQSATGSEIQQIRKLAQQRNIAISTVPQAKIDRLTQVPSQGVVAIAGLINYHALQDIIDQVVEKGESPLIVVLDNITDTRNLGAIARSAHCFGAHAIVLPLSNTAAVTEEAMKTSAGALAHIPVCREPSIQQIVDTLHLNGIMTLAMDLKGENLLQAELKPQPMAVIMGAEDVGVSKYVLKHAQQLLKIPQHNSFDSLNVSVATGVILYEIYKQRI